MKFDNFLVQAPLGHPSLPDASQMLSRCFPDASVESLIGPLCWGHFEKFPNSRTFLSPQKNSRTLYSRTPVDHFYAKVFAVRLGKDDVFQAVLHSNLVIGNAPNVTNQCYFLVSERLFYFLRVLHAKNLENCHHFWRFFIFDFQLVFWKKSLEIGFRRFPPA